MTGCGCTGVCFGPGLDSCSVSGIILCVSALYHRGGSEFWAPGGGRDSAGTIPHTRPGPRGPRHISLGCRSESGGLLRGAPRAEVRALGSRAPPRSKNCGARFEVRPLRARLRLALRRGGVSAGIRNLSGWVELVGSECAHVLQVVSWRRLLRACVESSGPICVARSRTLRVGCVVEGRSVGVHI